MNKTMYEFNDDWGDIPEGIQKEQIKLSQRDEKASRAIREAGLRAVHQYWDPTTNTKLKQEDMVKKFGDKLTKACYDNHNGYPKELMKALHDTVNTKEETKPKTKEQQVDIEKEKKKAVAAERRRITLLKKKEEEEARIEAARAPYLKDDSALDAKPKDVASLDDVFDDTITTTPAQQEILVDVKPKEAYDSRLNNTTPISNTFIGGHMQVFKDKTMLFLQILKHRPFKRGHAQNYVWKHFYEKGLIVSNQTQKEMSNSLEIKYNTVQKWISELEKEHLLFRKKYEGKVYCVIGYIEAGQEKYFYDITDPKERAETWTTVNG